MHVQHRTAPISAGVRPALSSAARAACAASSSSGRCVYVRWPIPVLAAISPAVIGDQFQLALRMMSSLVQTYSPVTPASDSSRGMTENFFRISTGG